MHFINQPPLQFGDIRNVGHADENDSISPPIRTIATLQETRNALMSSERCEAYVKIIRYAYHKYDPEGVEVTHHNFLAVEIFLFTFFPFYLPFY